ncbi:MAG: putative ABC transporter ATP-binding protein YknY [Planctomycetes bacterium]|nr:putative ABC transporter ATP-binding protein YknY [Planctomycetota bacterium]
MNGGGGAPPAAAAEAVLHARGIRRWHGQGDARVEILRGVDLDVRRGEYVAIMGASGSGKSTLLSILGCLDRPNEGTYRLQGRDVLTLRDDELSEMRLRSLGFVFQAFHLVPQLSVLQNAEMPLFYAGVPPLERKRIAAEHLARVGLSHRLGHRPPQLSGGEQQRAAIARALVLDPPILFADEPTGNLDSANGAAVLELLREIHAEGRTVVMVTHDPDIAARADRTIVVRDGCVVEQRGAAA